MTGEPRFAFGENWERYSASRVDEGRIEAAGASLRVLLGRGVLKGLRFLDVGCGSGLFSIAASRMGAEVVGFDVDEKCVAVSRGNASRFGVSHPVFLKADILKPESLAGLGLFDVVYAWGSLHHTGRLWTGLEAALGFVKPGGMLVLGIYNRHWSSGVWGAVKRFYNRCPRHLRPAVEVFFCAVIAVAKGMALRGNPFRSERGMDFYRDVVDWVGGYPYECAMPSELIPFVEQRGCRLKGFWPARVPTGNNEYVFERAQDPASFL